MKAIHAVAGIALAGVALLGGQPIAHAQNTSTTAAAPAQQRRVATFMKIDGLTGSATDRSHQGWIEINSFQWGVGRGVSSPTGSGADRQGSTPAVSEIVITRVRDVASPKLLQAAQSGKHIPEVAIEFVRGDKQVVYQVKLTDVLISRYSLSSGGDRPTESMSLAFAKISWTYSNQKPDGTTGAAQTAPAGWDITQVTKS